MEDISNFMSNYIMFIRFMKMYHLHWYRYLRLHHWTSEYDLMRMLGWLPSTIKNEFLTKYIYRKKYER